MKFKIDKERFLNAVSIVWRSVWSNPTMPVLENIYLKSEDWKIYFMATDLDLEISYFIDWVEIEENWEITVPAKLLQSYLNFLKAWDVEFQTKDDDIILKSKSWKTKIKWLSSKDFPRSTEIKSENKFSINSKILKNAIAESIFSVSTSMSRPFLTWINFNINWKNLSLMSTDSYRFTQKKIELNSEFWEPQSIIIPAKTAQEVSKLIWDWWMIWWEDFDVNINFSNDQILFKIWDITLSSRLIAWKFPDLQCLFQKKKN